MTLINYRPFRIVGFIGSLITIIPIFIIGYTTIWELGICGTPDCFSNFLTYYSFPMKAATATLAILGIIGMIHRSEQTAKQIKIANDQNIYSNYFSHIKEFKECINKLDLELIKPQDINKLYRIIFPLNTYTNVDPIGRLDLFNAQLEDMSIEINLAIEQVSKNYCEVDSKPYLPMQFMVSFPVVYLPLEITDNALIKLKGNEYLIEKHIKLLGFNFEWKKQHILISANKLKKFPENSWISKTCKKQDKHLLNSGDSDKYICINSEENYQLLYRDIIKVYIACQEISLDSNSDDNIDMIEQSKELMSGLNKAIIKTISDNYEEEIF